MDLNSFYSSKVVVIASDQAGMTFGRCIPIIRHDSWAHSLISLLTINQVPDGVECSGNHPLKCRIIITFYCDAFALKNLRYLLIVNKISIIYDLINMIF